MTRHGRPYGVTIMHLRAGVALLRPGADGKYPQDRVATLMVVGTLSAHRRWGRFQANAYPPPIGIAIGNWHLTVIHRRPT